MTAKDFFQDILPKDDPKPLKKERIQGDEVEVPSDSVPEATPHEIPGRSIRNINVNRQRPLERMTERTPVRAPVDRREVPPVGSGVPKARGIKTMTWVLIAVAIVVILGIIVAMAFQSTSITVVPRAQTIVFDSSKNMTAYPAATAPAGSLTYTVQTFEVDESEAVSSSGSTFVERKASGSVTLVNEYSTAPVKLVKTTRFETPEGLIFRAPADITIPGMKGNAPGTINVTIVADAPGDKYNVGPISKLTLPGLKGGAMYAKVYARSLSSFTGGFSGNEPSVPADIKNAAISELQGRLKSKVESQLVSPGSDTLIFPSFATVSYVELPPSPSSDAGKVNLNLRAKVGVPAFSTSDFNRRIAATVSADAENAQITLVPAAGFSASIVNATSTSYGNSPITVALAGSAQLVWAVNGDAITTALAGKDESAFQTIINSFPGVQEARARIEPFWRHTFPADPKSIQIIIAEPKESSE